jgi:hypothetical protein
MLRLLLAKDLTRARRNPLPWLIFLLVPLFAVALIGGVFGGAGKQSQALGRIRLGVVDEDDSVGSRILCRSLAGMKEGQELALDTVPADRTHALAQLNANLLSAVLILPKGLVDDYLHSRPTRLELIKNPTESIKPTFLEEGAGVLVTGLNGVSRNFAGQFAGLEAELGGPREIRSMARLLTRIDDTLASLENADLQGRVWYTKGDSAAPAKTGDTTNPAAGGAGFNLFGYLLLGMAAMFLLFLGGTGIADLHRELEQRTFARFQTVRLSPAPFLVAKVLFVAVMLLLCSGILFGGGALVFGVAWKHPLELGALVLAYVVFTTGLMALIVAWLPERRKADALRTMVSMALGMAGGCAFPLDQVPPFYRDTIMPWLPTHWFVSTSRALEYGGGTAPWVLAALKLALAGALCLALASWLFRRRFRQGARA